MREQLRAWMRGGNVVPLRGAEELEELFAASWREPVVLFLHDPYCPVSALARLRLRQYRGRLHLVDVSRQQDLSRRIEELTGVRHESPQALVLWRGEAVWHASHGAVGAEDVGRAVEGARGGG